MRVVISGFFKLRGLMDVAASNFVVIMDVAASNFVDQWTWLLLVAFIPIGDPCVVHCILPRGFGRPDTVSTMYGGYSVHDAIIALARSS